MATSASMLGIRTIAALPIENKRVFIRCDFNVPMDGGKIVDDSRVREALPTLRHAIERDARIVLASHLGRPKRGPERKYSLEPVASCLADLLARDVTLPEDCVGDAARKVVYDLRAGQVVLLENLRFHPEEEADDEGFCRQLSQLADVYVDDAFGCVHRPHASVHGLARMYRDRGCGFLLEKEISSLAKIAVAPEKPFVAVLGGAKVGDKIAVIESLLERVTTLVVGGAMANTLLAAKGRNMQASLVEGDKLALARTLLEKAQAKGVEVLLPVDVVVAASTAAAEGRVVSVDDIPPGTMALDVGPRTIEAFARTFTTSKTVFWNGPMGLFEKAPFSAGTFGLARALAASSAFTVVGGGDSAAAVRAAGADVAARIKHVSTGGGASLELIEGKKLPGIEVLRSAT
jgi:phosphoglycerate kinase